MAEILYSRDSYKYPIFDFKEIYLSIGILTETIAADPKNPTGVIHYEFQGDKKDQP